MADENDPPRKFYGLKPRNFERVNPAPEAGSSPAAEVPSDTIPIDPGPAAATDAPIDTRELARAAATNMPLLTGNAAANRDNEIHALLRENLARANAAGLNDLAPQKRRRSRRWRDYLLSILLVNGAIIALVLWLGVNAVTFVFGLGGIAIVTTGLAWVMFGVMDDY